MFENVDIMKVLFLNTFDAERGGSARSSYRLLLALQDIGINTLMLVQRKVGDEKTIIGPSSRIGMAAGIFRPPIDMLPVELYRKWTRMMFSLSILPDRLPSKVAEQGPDIIHLHWVAGGFMRIETLRKFTQPIVWTLRDSWAFTGGCHLPLECTRYRQTCGKCPALGSTTEWDLSHWVWKRKFKSWKNLRRLTIVTPSNWMASCARSSSLFQNMRIEVIPNGVNLKRYAPLDKQYARKLFSLPPDKKVILFGAINNINDKHKGFHLLISALRMVAKAGWKDRAELAVLGSSEPVNVPDVGFKTHYLGRLHDDISLALLYSAADVFVAPYMQDNLPNMIIEAMACGTPSVAFKIGGVPDLIEHESTGYLARPFEIEDLAHGIIWVLENANRWQTLSAQARLKAEREFDIQTASYRYAQLYAEILGNG